ncbi:HlyD family efflux transporter periplasmic adaptor subunit [Paenibacillus sp. GYB003]|uniref:HlyD family efflux transporter periplasmic adaptor subunit n=1 Tax=Paenibacillus sp. GYB003 TaxID=2994392 RepID=UPI002F96B966
MNRNVFRKTSLERMSTPDKLDVLITITRPPYWIALASVLLLVAAAVAWSLTAAIPVRIGGAGVLTTPGGVVQVNALQDGQLTDISVEPGQYVERGQTIARMYNPAWAEAARPGDPAAQERLAAQTKVVAMQEGTVAAVHRGVGEWVKSGDSVVALQTGDPRRDMEAVVYLPLEKAKAIGPGTAVRVKLSGEAAGENGALVGEVAHVASIPADRDRMLRMTGNAGMVEQFARQGPVAEVRIRLEREPAHPSGLRWTAPKTDSRFVPQSGLPCAVDFTIRTVRPIEWLF